MTWPRIFPPAVAAAARRHAAAAVFLLLAAVVGAEPAMGQYFGRNKVQYENFKFQVLRTEHFDIYFYPEEREAVEDASRMAERWYARLSKTLNRSFSERKPIILYANQADFQQTNVIEGLIGEGTGGVTESLKNRVVLPLTGLYRENDHVLGHELVHAFQYDIAQAPEDTGGFNIGRMPLWLVEGMAEYLSLGRDHPLTSLWLRDAVLHNDFPTMDQLSRDSRYFPYRFGHALWAYVGGRWGDERVGRIYRLAGRIGVEEAFLRETGLGTELFSKEWARDTRAALEPLIADRTKPGDVGRRLIGESDGRDLHLAPTVSPDGRRVAYFSQHDLFSIDLYIADAETGERMQKLVSLDRNAHIDALRFIDSAGTWSPDGLRFAFVVFSEGDNQLAIADVKSRSVQRNIRPEGVDAITNPAWSPDGRTIAFSGSVGGVSDIFLMDVASGAVRRLTNDKFADLQPAWSRDGSSLAVVTDRRGTDLSTLEHGPLRIGIIPVDGGEVRMVSLFTTGDHINPQFSPDGRELYFIADQDGVSDIYRASLQGGAISRITRSATGISGITSISPALTVANDGRLFFSVFEKRGYTIHALDPAAMNPVAESGGGPSLAILPPREAQSTVLVDTYLDEPRTGIPAAAAPSIRDYSAALQLDYIGAATSGVVVDRFGTSLGGAIGVYLSDMLGNRSLEAAIQANGGLKDLGAQAVFQNRANRWNWGFGGGHIPYLSAFTRIDTATVEIDGELYNADVIEQVRERVFVDRGLLLATYPFSTTRRLEFSGGFTHYGFDTEVERLFVVDGVGVGSTVEDVPSPDGISFGHGSAALVGDNSFFGFTSPVKGQRYRLEVEPTFGSLQIVNLLTDYRRYFFANPVTLAFRGFHYGRYGRDSDNGRLSPLFLGYATYVRGYSSGSFELEECSDVEGSNCPEFDRLVGSRIGVANLEVRMPLFGTEEFGLIKFPFLPTELAGFIDAGVAWSDDDSPTFEFVRRTTERVPVVSAGVSARVNLFGALIGEVYYAYPFQRPDKGAHFGFQLAPGW